MRKSVSREEVDVRELWSALDPAHWGRSKVTTYQVPMDAITRVLHRASK